MHQVVNLSLYASFAYLSADFDSLVYWLQPQEIDIDCGISKLAHMPKTYLIIIKKMKLNDLSLLSELASQWNIYFNVGRY